MPREFRDYEDFCRVADELITAAGVDDYTYIWWDVRPHPQLGTVEVRAVDVQMDAAGSSAIAALDSVRPYARELGSETALTEIERILREGNGADEQRRVYRQAGMAGLLSHRPRINA